MKSHIKAGNMRTGGDEGVYIVISSLASLGVEALEKTSVAPGQGKFFYYRASACSSAHCREADRNSSFHLPLCLSEMLSKVS